MILRPILLILLFCSTLFAQVDPPATNIEFYPSSASDSFYARVKANTINENLLVVYQNRLFNNSNNIYCRTLSPSGQLGIQRVVASGLTSSGKMDLVWHPDAKRYMLVFVDGTDLKVRVIRATGKFAGGVKKINTYTSGDFSITPAKNKRFVLFFLRDADLVAMSLRKNGKIFKSEKVLISHSGGVFKLINPGYHISKGMMTNDKESVIFYLFEYNKQVSGTLRCLKVDHKLNEIGDQAVGDLTAPFSDSLFAEYHPEKQVYFVLMDGKYKIYRYNSVMQTIWKPSPLAQTPTGICFDPVSQQFALLSTYHWEISGTNQGARFYMSFINSGGTFVTTEMLVHFLYNDTVNFSSIQVGFNPGGLYLITWGWDYPTHGGFFGRFFN